jgi:hypothetical protein
MYTRPFRPGYNIGGFQPGKRTECESSVEYLWKKYKKLSIGPGSAKKDFCKKARRKRVWSKVTQPLLGGGGRSPNERGSMGTTWHGEKWRPFGFFGAPSARHLCRTIAEKSSTPLGAAFGGPPFRSLLTELENFLFEPFTAYCGCGRAWPGTEQLGKSLIAPMV